MAADRGEMLETIICSSVLFSRVSFGLEFWIDWDLSYGDLVPAWGIEFKNDRNFVGS
jgi:hypothetical protein